MSFINSYYCKRTLEVHGYNNSTRGYCSALNSELHVMDIDRLT